MTYGEEVLAQAEATIRAQSARRRTMLLLTPTVATILWALSDLIAARHARLIEAGVGPAGQFIDHITPIVWTIGLVLLPMISAIRHSELPAGAFLAFLAGPMMSTALFGPGGWKWWQLLVVTGASALVVSAGVARARD